MPTTSVAGPRKILIAEDDEDARLLLGMLLRASGYEVVEAADGLSALRTIEEGGLDVALMDLGLPGLDGETVARGARASAAGRSLCMVAVTGLSSGEDVARALQAGFDAHLPKPVDLSRLQDILAAHDA